MNFREEQKQRTEQIEQILRRFLPEAKGEQRLIMEAMEYSLLAGGKRLRPMLMWETYRLFGGKRIGCGTVHGCDGDDPHIFTRT